MSNPILKTEATSESNCDFSCEDVSCLNRKISVLVVDDDRMSSHIALKMFESIGASSVVVASNGIDALRQVRSQSFDLIFCDLCMPEMDGVEFIRHLAECEFPGEIILASGQDETLMASVRKLGSIYGLKVLGCLRKPVKCRDLTELLNIISKPIPQSVACDRLERLSVEDVRIAIAEGRIVNVYQPKIDLVSGRVHGVETLARLRHTDGSILSPAYFIGIAETNGLLEQLTNSVFLNAVSDVAAWSRQGVALDFAVNFGLTCFSSTGLANFVLDTLKSAGIASSRFTVEITESQLTKNDRQVLEVLNRLRLRGVRLSIDDFGTGYATFSQFHKIPYHELKLDHSFVSNALIDQTSKMIVRSTVAMAQSLGLITVAEGIEDAETAKHVSQLGVNYGQGFHYSEPLQASEIVRYVTKQTKSSNGPGSGKSASAKKRRKATSTARKGKNDTMNDVLPRGIVHVVDDDSTARKSMVWLLRTAGIDTREYACAQDFLVRFKPDHPCCIITDLNMPGIDGYELIRTLRSRKVSSPVILVTAFRDMTDRQASNQLEIDSFFEKPIVGNSILQRTRDALDREVARAHD